MMTDLDLELIRAGSHFANLINRSRQLRGVKDSHVHTSFNPSTDTLEIGGTGAGRFEKDVTLMVTKW